MIHAKEELTKIQEEKSKNNNRYSIIKTLRNQNKSNDYFEIMLSNLSMEDIIALKLELTYKSTGIVLYGFPLLKAGPKIMKHALIKYALSVAGSKSMAARILGTDIVTVSNIIKKYNLQDIYKSIKYNKKKENNNVTNSTTT